MVIGRCAPGRSSGTSGATRTRRVRRLRQPARDRVVESEHPVLHEAEGEGAADRLVTDAIRNRVSLRIGALLASSAVRPPARTSSCPATCASSSSQDALEAAACCGAAARTLRHAPSSGSPEGTTDAPAGNSATTSAYGTTSTPTGSRTLVE